MKQPAISAANKTYRVIQNAESNNDNYVCIVTSMKCLMQLVLFYTKQLV